MKKQQSIKKCLHIACHYSASEKGTLRVLECSQCGELLRVDGLKRGEWEKGISKRRANYLFNKENSTNKKSK